MPNIPSFKSERLPGVQQPQQIDVGALTAESRAMAGFGEKLSNTAGAIGDSLDRQRKIEADADRTLKALEFDRDLSDKVSNFTETYQGRQDYEIFESDLDNFLTETRTDLLDQSGGDKILQAAFERKYNQHSSNLATVVKAKKLDVMSNRAVGAFEVSVNEQLRNYSEEINPQQREIIRGEIELGAASLVANGFITQKQEEDYIKKFDDRAEALRADQHIDADPNSAEESLRGDGYPDLDPTVKQQKIEKAMATQRNRIEQESQIEANAAKKLKKYQENNAVKWTVDYDKELPLDMDRLQEDLSKGKITREFYNSFLTSIENGLRSSSSDQDEILDLETLIRNGDPDALTTINNSSKVTPKDKRLLLDKYDAYADNKFKEDNTQGEALLKARIITTGLFQPFAEGEQERLSAAKIELFDRLKAKEPLNEIIKDMIPRYDTDPIKLKDLPKPRFVTAPTSLAEVVKAKDTFRFILSEGSIDIYSKEGQNIALRELELLQNYENIYRRRETNAR